MSNVVAMTYSPFRMPLYKAVTFAATLTTQSFHCTTELLARKLKMASNWIKPNGASLAPNLRIWNTLTKKKEEFVTINGKTVTWYCCGPTVYDAAHLGHARAYISFDIIRRVLSNYFGYSINYVMNITDVDDKIIVKARQQHLLGRTKSLSENDATATLQILTESLDFYLGKNFNLKIFTNKPSADDAVKQWTAARASILATKSADSEEEFKLKSKVDLVDKCFALLVDWKNSASNLSAIWDMIGDVVALKLDAEEGHTISDQHVFEKFARFWEIDFLKDMQMLNVQPPTVMTRVSEYIPEIIALVEGIIKNGYGYVSEGSVYFDVTAYHGHNGHCYAKMRPQSLDEVNTKLMEEGEGSLGSRLVGKKNPRDFALWKCSKPGEPMWESPWGMGRPGWHIECSGMASSVIPGSIDIHSGGIDLVFPHHDNELAQSEGFYDCDQWVNYFMHAGHLNIEGQKMSKSLKNFITIKEALAHHTWRQIRIMFLQHSWNSLLDYKEGSLRNAVNFENSLNSFFTNITAHLNDLDDVLQLNGLPTHNYRELEQRLRASLDLAVQSVHNSLCDSFDTPSAMAAIQSLISAFNTYAKDKQHRSLHRFLIKEVAVFVHNTLKSFGVYRDNEFFDVQPASDSSNEESGQKRDDKALLASIIAEFRFKIRSLAASKADPAAYFKACDNLRDVDCLNAGIIFEDRDEKASLIKLIDQDAVLKIKQEREEELQKSAALKNAHLAELERKKQEKLEKSKISPAVFLKNDALYSRYDERGIPTHDADDKELSKSALKKLTKQFEDQLSLYQEYLDTIQKK